MWRLLGRLGRGAARLPGAETPPARARQTDQATPPAPPAPPWQQDAGSRGEHQHHEHGCWNILHHCTSLGAFTWGVLAVLALELAKQVQWLNTVQPSGRRARLCQLEDRLAVLPLHLPSVPPVAVAAAAPAPFREGKKPHFFVGADSWPAPEHHGSGRSSPPEESIALSESGDIPSDTSPEWSSASLSSQGSAEQESFREAASQVQQAFQASISLAFNILGLEHLQSRQDTAAFSFFKLAADQNYSKAQFNVGLCYEHGRGTEKDMAKAVLYYRRAAQRGHTMAQYRYAKWLLRSWPNVEDDSRVQEAVDLLGQAAAAGLTQAQAYLRVLRLKGMKTGKKRALEYVHLAATSEDSLSRLPVGIHCGKGFGRPQHPWAARKLNQQADVAEPKPAQERMPGTVQLKTADTQNQHPLAVALRPIFSSPTLQSPSQLPFSHVRHPVLDLIHSWSTGNLRDGARLPHAAFCDCFSRSPLQPLACSSGVAVG